MWTPARSQARAVFCPGRLGAAPAILRIGRAWQLLASCHARHVPAGNVLAADRNVLVGLRQMALSICWSIGIW